MAAVTGRDRMIKSMNELTGRDDCSEAILAQERPSWTPFVLFALAIGAGIFLSAAVDLNAILAGAIVGGLIGVGFAATTKYWVLGRCGTDVILARSSKFSAKAVEVVDRWSAPVRVDQKKGLLQNRLMISGRTLMIARQFAGRVEAIVR